MTGDLIGRGWFDHGFSGDAHRETGWIRTVKPLRLQVAREATETVIRCQQESPSGFRAASELPRPIAPRKIPKLLTSPLSPSYVAHASGLLRGQLMYAKKIIVVMPDFNAAKTLQRTHEEVRDTAFAETEPAEGLCAALHRRREASREESVAGICCNLRVLQPISHRGGLSLSGQNREVEHLVRLRHAP